MRLFFHLTRKEYLLGISLLICIGVYWHGLDGPWMFDDIPHLLPLVEHNLIETGIQNLILSPSGPLSRPVAMATFLFNASLSNDIWWWKLTNLVIHLLTGIAIYFLMKKLITFGNSRPRKYDYIPLAVSVIWLLHPLQISTVLYTVQRMTQLSALFVVLTLLAYTCARISQLSGKKCNNLFFLTVLVFFPLAVFSKENGLLIPVYLFLLEILIFKFQGPNAGLFSIKNIKYFMWGTVLVSGLLLLIFFRELIINKYALREFTLYERLLTEARVVVEYIYMILLPAQKNMGFMHDDLIISTGLFSPLSTLISILFIAFMLLIAIVPRKISPFLSLGILLFFAAHLMESTIFPLELMFEHRNYFASIGLILAAVTLIADLMSSPRLRNTSLIFLVIIITPVTYLRADTWSSTESLFRYIYSIHPQSTRLMAYKANELAGNGFYKEAKSVLMRNDDLGAYFQYANIECMENETINDQNITGKNIKPDAVLNMYAMHQLELLFNRILDGKCTVSFNSYQKLIKDTFERPITDHFEGHKLYIYQANVLWLNGINTEALKSLNKAINLVPDDPLPMYIAADFLIQDKDYVHAREYLNMAKKITSANHAYVEYEKELQELLNTNNKD